MNFSVSLVLDKASKPTGCGPAFGRGPAGTLPSSPARSIESRDRFD